MSDNEWSDATVIRLRTLWAEGHSTAEIGRRLGFSKNAVVGKVHRLDLPARPSPIRPRDPSTPSRRRSRTPVPKLADLMPMASTGTSPANTMPGMSAPPRKPSPSRARSPMPAPRPKPDLRALAGPTTDCCWPIGEPGARGFRFCGETSLHGRPYCEDHAGIAYVRPRERRESQTQGAATPVE